MPLADQAPDNAPSSTLISGTERAENRDQGGEIRRVNVDFPAWVVTGLDREADRLGVTRQALIKIWIADRLDQIGQR